MLAATPPPRVGNLTRDGQLHRGIERSQRYNITQVETCIIFNVTRRTLAWHSIYKMFTFAETVDPTWDDIGAGIGLSMAPPQGSEQLYNNTQVCTSLLSN